MPQSSIFINSSSIFSGDFSVLYNSRRQTGVDDISVDATGWISDNVEDSGHKIFIAGISKFISAQMLMEIAGAFGSLKAFHFEHNVEVDVQYAFLEVLMARSWGDKCSLYY